MTNRLTLFEFINFNTVKDFRVFVTDIVNNLKLMQEEVSRLNKSNIDVYAPEGVRAQLKNKANEIILRVAGNLKATPPNLSIISPDLQYLEDILYILNHFKSEVGSETVVNIKNLITRAKQIFPDIDKTFKSGQLANDDSSIMPLDPNTPRGTIETPLANQASNAKRDAARFDNTLGLEGIKQLGRVKTP